MLALAFVLFFGMLILGVPIAFAMGLGSALALFFKSDTSIMLVGQRLFAGVNSFSLMAIPFFMLA